MGIDHGRGALPASGPCGGAQLVSSSGASALAENATPGIMDVHVPRSEIVAPAVFDTSLKPQSQVQTQLSRAITARQRGLDLRESCKDRISQLQSELKELQERKAVAEKRVRDFKGEA